LYKDSTFQKPRAALTSAYHHNTVLVAHISGHHNGNFPLRTSAIESVDMLGAASHATDAETIFLAVIEGGGGVFNGHWLVTWWNEAQGGKTRHFAAWLWVQEPVL